MALAEQGWCDGTKRLFSGSTNCIVANNIATASDEFDGDNALITNNIL